MKVHEGCLHPCPYGCDKELCMPGENNHDYDGCNGSEVEDVAAGGRRRERARFGFAVK